MALRTAGSMHMSMSSQSSVHAACGLEEGGMTPKRSACQSSDEGVEVLSTSVVTAFVSASPGESVRRSRCRIRRRRSRKKCREKSRG
eukprot:4021387-Pleurochrysis_carterae.AAC.1